MKKILFSCALLILVLDHTSFGQRVYFSDTTNYWMTRSSIGGGGGDPLMVSYHDYSLADTIIEWNGHSYSQLGYTLVRDDTNAHTVVMKPLTNSVGLFRVVDTVNEFIYMDYNLQAGDTFHIPLIYNHDSLNIFTVSGTGTAFFSNEWHKAMSIKISRLFDGGEWWTDAYYTFIEGIGTLNGPFIDIMGDGEWPPQSLICFKNRSTIPRSDFSDCSPNPISVNEPASAVTDFDLFPDPASGSFQIRYTGKNTGTFQLHLTDMIGREQAATTFHKNATIDIAALRPGIYFARILQNGVLLQTKKLVISKQ